MSIYIICFVLTDNLCYNTEYQSVLPEKEVSMYASTLIKPVIFRSDPDYYPGQWVIGVNDADLASILICITMIVIYRLIT